MAKRQCSYCGAFNSDSAQICSNCRESLVAVHVTHPGISPAGMAKVRRGVIYILLAGGLHYFAAGHSGISLPVQIIPAVNAYLIPFLFLCGAGLVVYGLFLRVKS